jgi:hypothetical protein
MAESYRPTVNIAQAPPFLVPMPFVLGGLVALAVVGVRMVELREVLASGLWALPAVVLTAHTVTLGFLTLTMTGLLYQWVPVVFDVAAVPRAWSWSEGALYTVGLILFLWGWAVGDSRLVEAGGLLLATSLTFWAAVIGYRVAQAPREADTVTVGLGLALAGVTTTWVLGLRMAFGAATPAALGLHIATALVAWVGTLVATVQLKLMPMFTMARVTRRTLAPLPVAALWAGLAAVWLRGALDIPQWVPSGLWTLAALASLYQLLTLRRKGKAPTTDPVLVPVAMGWILWLVAAGLASVRPVQAVVLAFFGAMTFILGYQSRIIPFMVAVVISRRTPGPPHRAFFMARGMGSTVAPPVTAALLSLAAVAVVVGMAAHGPTLVGLGGMLVVGAVAAQMVLLGQRLQAAKASAPLPPSPSRQ